MNRFIPILVILSLAYSTTFAAIKVVECEDEEGNRSFQSACPPGTKQVNEKKVATGTSGGARGTETGNLPPVTIYTIPDCGDSCNSVKDFFQNQNISFSEKDVSENLDMQNELRDLTGQLKVPTITIGEKVIIGYKRGDIQKTLQDAGYIQPEVEENPELSEEANE